MDSAPARTPALKALLRKIYYWGPSLCPACGQHARMRFDRAMWPELGEQWQLTAEQYEWFDRREGLRCAYCGSNLRCRQLASVIVDRMNARLGTVHSCLRDLCLDRRAAELTVAEINASGGLHSILASLPGLHYSEYGSQSPAVRSEDLSALSYSDAMFDLVLTSDTLEHVPHLDAALTEIRRVLKPEGLHIFTVPVVWDRDTRVRASVVGDELVHHLPPSHHGAPSQDSTDFLVFHEFGRDIGDRIEAAGFELSVVRDPRNPALTTFVARRA